MTGNSMTANSMTGDLMTDANGQDAMERMTRQIAFLVEVDRLKEVLRQTMVLQSRRRENTAEHSWHVALLAMTLHEYANEPVDLLHVIKMLLVHDIVEIDAGDTFAFGDQSHKAADEEAAALRIFGLLPPDQRAEYIGLWHEFDARQTPASHFANAMDRLMPALHNYNGEGGTWRLHKVNWQQVLGRMKPIGDGSTALYAWLYPLLEEARDRGDILTPPTVPEHASEAPDATP
jgi:putative hydrolase of HD superfamily